MGFKMGVAIAQEAIDTVQYELKDTVLARELLKEGFLIKTMKGFLIKCLTSRSQGK
jgi:hypothetical protein